MRPLPRFEGKRTVFPDSDGDDAPAGEAVRQPDDGKLDAAAAAAAHAAAAEWARRQNLRRKVSEEEAEAAKAKAAATVAGGEEDELQAMIRRIKARALKPR